MSGSLASFTKPGLIFLPVIPSEIFPLHLRSIGLSYAVPGMWGANLWALFLPLFLVLTPFSMSVISARVLPKNVPELSYYMAAIVCASAFFAASRLNPCAVSEDVLSSFFSVFLFPETKAFVSSLCV